MQLLQVWLVTLCLFGVICWLFGFEFGFEFWWLFDFICVITCWVVCLCLALLLRLIRLGVLVWWVLTGWLLSVCCV